MPQQVDIAVLDGMSASVLLPLFGRHRYEAIDLNEGAFYVHPWILLATLRHLVATRTLAVAYVMAVLDRMKPSIVVTWNDNSGLFQATARRYQPARFLAIQNGSRLLERDHPPGSTPVFHREFACFGRFEIDQFTRHGARVEKYYAVGSLNDSYYRARRRLSAAVTRTFDLCLVSQLRPSVATKHSERLDSFERLVAHVSRFCESRQITVCVALRRHPDSDPAVYEWEREFFETRLAGLAELFANRPGAYTTYELVDASRVSIGMHTTVLREGFGRGRRILSCNYTGNPVYDFPVPGPWSLTDAAYEAFEQKLAWLLTASDAAYADACGEAPSYQMAYDDRMPTHTFLQHLIAEAVTGRKETASCV